jgi:large subunit ribosomal protein L6
MEKTYTVPNGVEVHVHNMHIKVKGAHGELSKDFEDPRFNGLINIHKEGDLFKVTGLSENKKVSAMVGTIAAHVKNMALGVSNGYVYEMKILYTHFPITVVQAGREIQVKNFFGEKSIRTAEVVGNVDVKIEKDTITIAGINVEEVGQTAANIERACKLRNRDRRIFQDGIYLDSRKLKTGEHV